MKKKKNDLMVLKRKLSKNPMNRILQIKNNKNQSFSKTMLLSLNLSNLKKDPKKRSQKNQKMFQSQSLSKIKMLRWLKILKKRTPSKKLRRKNLSPLQMIRMRNIKLKAKRTKKKSMMKKMSNHVINSKISLFPILVRVISIHISYLEPHF